MSNVAYGPRKDGSHIQLFTKEQVMQCARDLIMRYHRSPNSLKGIKFPFGLSIKDNTLTSLEYHVSYYGQYVGTVDLHAFGITYAN